MNLRGPQSPLGLVGTQKPLTVQSEGCMSDSPVVLKKLGESGASDISGYVT